MEKFSIEKIKKILPHRYPFLLVDRVNFIKDGPHPGSTKGMKIEALKNVSINEEFFNGHFPGNPVMPGVLILEAMGQTGALLGSYSFSDKSFDDSKIFVIAAVIYAKFRRPVFPGDQIVLRVESTKTKGKMGRFVCTAKVDDQLVAEAEFLAALQPKKAIEG